MLLFVGATRDSRPGFVGAEKKFYGPASVMSNRPLVFSYYNTADPVIFGVSYDHSRYQETQYQEYDESDK